jgi:CRP/FNR family transcriptional regulator, cyclic AMP receptor protein
MAAGRESRHARTVPPAPSGALCPRAELLRGWPAAPPAAVRLADADRRLLYGVPDELLGAARRALVAPLAHLPSGRWEPDRGRRDGWLGLLVLDGLLVRGVEVGGLRCCELLGSGDLLRPWDEEDLDVRVGWRVLQPTRLALLDAGFAGRACRWPSVVAELMQRGMLRSRSLSVLLAATQARRADVRLRTLFWHLADRWGRVTPDGVRLELLLTHAVIAELTGMRRPSVSLNLAKLERAGEIVRAARDQWIIRRRAEREPAA